MQIRFTPFDSWTLAQENLKESLTLPLGLTPDMTCRPYRNFGQAILEVTMGLARFFPHRKKIWVNTSLTPYFFPILQQLSGEELEVHEFKTEDLSEVQNKVCSSATETLFVLFAVDDPILGLRFEADALKESVDQARVFHIAVSHLQCFNLGKKHRYGIEIVGLEGEETLVFLPKKAPIHPFSAQYENWTPARLTQLRTQVTDSIRKDGHRDLIEKFEKTPPAEAKAFFTKPVTRTWDRAVLYWTDMDGHSVVAYLAEELGFQLQPPGEERRLETLSLSRWGGLKTMDWIKSGLGISDEMARGLVVISADLLSPELDQKLDLVRQRIWKAQGF